MNDYQPIQPIYYTPADTIRQESAESIWQNQQVLASATVLGLGLLALFGFLLISWMPGDKTKIEQLETQLRQVQSQSTQQQQQLTQYEKMIADQTHTVAGLRDQLKEKDKTIDQIKSIVNGETLNASSSNPAHNNH